MKRHNSFVPCLIEPLEPRIAPAVDLTVVIDSIKLPDPTLAVPGDAATINYTITNAGDTLFKTSLLEVNVWLSKQTGAIPNPIANDIALHAKYRTVVDGKPNTSVTLGPGDSVKKSVRFDMPDLILGGSVDPNFVFGETPFNFTPGTGFHLIVEVDPNFFFDGFSHANNHAASAAFEWQYQFGQVNGRHVVLSASETGDGTLASFDIAGPGMGEFELSNFPVPATDLVFTGTSAASVAFAGVFKGPSIFSDNRIRLDDITALSTMKGLKLPRTDVTGDLNFPLGLASLIVGDLGTDKVLIIGAVSGTPPATIFAERVTGLTAVVNAGIADLDVTDWQKGAGSGISAPFITNIDTNGDRKESAAGDFAANLTLSGANAKGYALGKAKVVGALKNVTITTTGTGKIGDIGAVSAESLTINAQGDAENIYIAQNLLGVTATGLTAKSFSGIKIGGTLGNHITATGDNGKGVGIKSVTAKSIDGINITASAAGIEKITAGGWDNGGSLNAKWVKSIITKFGAGLSTTGDFTANVNITIQPGEPLPKGVSDGIGSADIAGALKGASWNVKNDIKSLVAGSVEAGWILAGGAVLPGQVSTTVEKLVVKGGNAGSFTAAFFDTVDFKGDFTGSITATNSIEKFTAANVIGATLTAAADVRKLTVQQWSGGNLTAIKFGDVTVTGGKGLPGDFKNLTLTATSPGLTGLDVLAVKGSIANVTFNVPNGTVFSITADEWSGGSLTAQGLRNLVLTGDKARTLAGDLFNVQIHLDDPLQKVTKIDAAGFIRDSGLQVFGNVGVIEALGVEKSNISVATARVLDKFLIQGKESGTDYFIASNLSAGTIGTVVLRNVETSNGGTPFGITAGAITNYLRTLNGAVEAATSNPTGTFDAEGDYRAAIN